MAKAPRRRGSGGQSSGRPGKPAKPVKPVKPVAAKPVKPAAAKPVRPAAAKPVRPAAAKPVAPKAKAVKPAAAAPVAKPAAAPSKPSGRGRSSEEEISGRHARGSARAAPGEASGIGLGAKIGLIAGALTLVVAAAAVLAGASSGGADPDGVVNEVGYRTVGELAAMAPSNWIAVKTTGRGADGFKTFKRNFVKVFGESRTYYFDDWIQQDTDTTQWVDMDPDEKVEAQARLNEFQEAKQKLQGGGGDDGAKPPPGAPMVLREVVRRMPQGDAAVSGTQVLTVWIRNGAMKHDGEWAVGAGAMKESQIQITGPWMQDGMYHWAEGVYKDAKGTPFDVRVFATAHQGRKVTAYAAVWRDTEKATSSSGAGMGLGIAALGALIVGFLASMLANNHTQGIRSLAREIDRLGTSGDATRHLHAHGPEASALAKSVERMVGNLEFRAKHDDQDLDDVISKEEKVAQEIHGALMSKNAPQLSGYEVETLFKPGFEIGGDHFEYFKIDDTHLGMVLLDTNVRGLSAALVMAQAKAYLRAAAPNNLSPTDVLRQVNSNLAGELPPGRHVTALYAVIDTAEGKATVASAGHLPMIVYRHSSGKVFKVNPEGIALGLDKGTVFDRSLEEGEIPIGVGDRIVLYTDGALMIQNEFAEEFGEQRFYQAVAKEAPKNSQAFVNFVGSAIDQFHLNAPQSDDITISTVKRLK